MCTNDCVFLSNSEIIISNGEKLNRTPTEVTYAQALTSESNMAAPGKNSGDNR